MADIYDLNAIRDTYWASQRAGSDAPTVKNEQVYVDRQGAVRLGNGGQQDAALTKVPHSTFAAKAAPREAADRLRRDRLVAAAKLPAGAYYDDEEGAEGWYYTIKTLAGNTYVFCACFDGGDYQVRLIEPELEKVLSNEHQAHLYRGGKVCLSDRPGSGQPTLEQAFARSSVWALGVDFVRIGKPFPFNVNQ